MSEEDQSILTLIILFGILVPSITLAFLVIRRVAQVLGVYGRGNKRIRRRFIISKTMAALAPICLFAVFQPWIVPPLPTKALLFCAGLWLLGGMFAYQYLAWNLWWDGIRPRRKGKLGT